MFTRKEKQEIVLQINKRTGLVYILKNRLIVASLRPITP